MLAQEYPQEVLPLPLVQWFRVPLDTIWAVACETSCCFRLPASINGMFTTVKKVLGAIILNDEVIAFDDVPTIVDAGTAANEVIWTVVDAAHERLWMAAAGVDEYLFAAHFCDCRGLDAAGGFFDGVERQVSREEVEQQATGEMKKVLR